ncbi:MAG: acyltransferase [Muribaculum sp.]|nr:acyltransferase [Muribaculum sp.]
MKQRNSYFDFLRGIAIIMVVGIHTVSPVREIDNWKAMAIIMVRQLLNCAVPLFLAISGYFIAKKDLSSHSKRLSFWKRQIPTVYIPCLVWSLGWFALSFFGKVNHSIVFKLLTLVVCGYSVYYFIALIMQLYIITPLLLRINNRGGGISRSYNLWNLHNGSDLYDSNRREIISLGGLCRSIHPLGCFLHAWNLLLKSFKNLFFDNSIGHCGRRIYSLNI